MLEGIAQAFFPRFDHDFPSRFVQMAKIERLIEVFGLDFAVVDEFED